MSDYKHKWVNDEARYYAIDTNGSSYEYLNKPTYKHRFNLPARWENGIKMWSVSVHFNDAKPADSLQQRYTTQQLELETQGWTLWNAGDEMPAINFSLAYEYNCTDCDGYIARPPAGAVVDWSDESTVVAYRLSNGDLYISSTKLSVNDNPEWKPPVGEQFQIHHHNQWWDCEVLMYSDGCAWVKQGEGHHTYNISCWKVRPIQTDKERVIAAAIKVQGILNPSFDCTDDLGRLYDNGMLSMPDKGEE